ncbi:hypothetical protein D104_03445 [Marinomonas profundimaris]|uniref:Uncharacterized protein n=1 Tax=Marinomonas profundimaris TaxID=1208321 RepID=W1S1U8_9GAMM|nr:hypothetical protein D104_03445 [Marinomonas profundimaris]
MRVYTFIHSALYGLGFMLLIDTKRLSDLLPVQTRKNAYLLGSDEN